MNVSQNALHNVALLKNEVTFQDIQIFLNNKRKRSESTAKAYEADIRLFFKNVRNKDIENLSMKDVKVSLPEVMSYQSLLIDSKLYKNTTINRMIASVESLYGYLKASEYDVNPFVFKEIDSLPDDTEGAGFLSPDEAKIIAELALLEKHSGKEKKALILLAASTSIRKNAVLKIRYEDIKPHDTKEGVYVIASDELFDKGKMVQDKEIHESLYSLLLELKGSKQESDKIFTISSSKLNEMIKRLCNSAGFDTRRNISFHSLKRAGIHLAFEIGGLYAAQMQAGHSSSDTTAKHYLKRETNIAGVAMFDRTPDDICDDMTREELLELVKMQQNGVWLQTKRNAVQIKEKRKNTLNDNGGNAN